MAQKVMLEVTQSVVDGNEVVIHAGELFDPGAKLPEGVTVRPVIVEADKPEAEEKAEEKPAPDEPKAEDKPAAKAHAKTPAR